MNIKGSSPVIMLIVLALVFFVAAAFGFYLYNQEHTKYIKLEEQIEEINTKYKISEAKLLEAQKVLVSLEIKLKESTAQIDELASELNRERASKAEVDSNLDQIRSELKSLEDIRLSLENKLAKAEDELVSMQEKLDYLELDKNDLILKVKELEESSKGVELGKIVVSPEPVSAKSKTKKAGAVKDSAKDSSSEKTVEGKVLVVNKEYNFVVINLGSKDGLSMGQVFSIYSGNNYTGDIKVEKLHDSMAAAGFLTDDLKNKVKEGDKVVKKG